MVLAACQLEFTFKHHIVKQYADVVQQEEISIVHNLFKLPNCMFIILQTQTNRLSKHYCFVFRRPIKLYNLKPIFTAKPRLRKVGQQNVLDLPIKKIM